MLKVTNSKKDNGERRTLVMWDNEDIHIYLDIELTHTEDFREVCEALIKAEERNTVIWHINSYGGSLDILIQLVDLIISCRAKNVGCIYNAQSAAGILAMYLDELIPSPFATLMVHPLQLWNVGSLPKIQTVNKHYQKISTNLFKNAYKGFLTDKEINDVLEKDTEFYFDGMEIVKRFIKRIEYLDRVREEQEEKELLADIENTASILEELKEIYETKYKNTKKENKDNNSTNNKENSTEDNTNNKENIEKSSTQEMLDNIEQTMKNTEQALKDIEQTMSNEE